MDLSLLYSHSCGIHLRRWNMHIDTSEEVHSWQLILPHKEKPSQLLHEYKSIHPIFRGIAMHDCSVSFIDCCWVLLMYSILSTCQHSNLTNWNLKIPKNLGAISFNLLPEISKLLSQAVFSTLPSFVHSPPQSVQYVNYTCNSQIRAEWCMWNMDL